MTTVLIVEDEKDILGVLSYNFEKEGFIVKTSINGEMGFEEAMKPPYPDLILLDLMLPGISGIDVCRKLRAFEPNKDVPVIILTARDDEFSKILSFEAEIDDYITKPFNVKEVILRAKAVLRRSNLKSSDNIKRQVGQLKLSPESFRAWVADREISLTAIEFKLLSKLLERRGRVQSRGQLLKDVWNSSSDVSTRTVDAHVKRLREKLGPLRDYIETVRGVGYCFKEEVDDGGIVTKS